MFAQQLSAKQEKFSNGNDDLTELTWLTETDILRRPPSSKVQPILSKSLPTYSLKQLADQTIRVHDDILSSDSEETDTYSTSSLNSSSEHVVTNENEYLSKPSSTVAVSPPHSALCFWILFAIEDSKNHALTLNEICEWIEQNIEQQSLTSTNSSSTNSTDEILIKNARLKSKIRYHMTKQISFFLKITKDPLTGSKLRYPLWTVDTTRRLLLLETLITMNDKQLSLNSEHTKDIYTRLSNERKRILSRHKQTNNSTEQDQHVSSTSELTTKKIKKSRIITPKETLSTDEKELTDENMCPKRRKERVSSPPTSITTKREKVHHLQTTEDTAHLPTKKRSRANSNTDGDMVDAAMTLLLLKMGS
ncbi:unnamed protein product [Didymodactylos carnosus]|uniref:Uncharacterized protein n=1 Tax=Didymodactylos carnosus TaxID=1234261 RepID=A0A814H9H1_9BILA|nr:unnamed protein product [Didymodactylos carnosus]CAF1219787.1 unnamed protein product [Didymodactylos carnosus]CAF3778351.1 unnamed protein product [Didymodactylos carnosus]CAF4027966.1 unnamed protein product [Didymodactylos carnosus]